MSEGAILQHLIHYEQNAKLYTTTQHYLKIKMKESLVLECQSKHLLRLQNTIAGMHTITWNDTILFQ